MLSLILGFLGYLVLRPFLTPLVWAAVLSIVFYPLYAFLIRYLRWKSVSAAVTLAIILLIIIGPVSYLSVLLVSEIQHLAAIIDKGEPASLQKVLENPNVVWVMDRVKVIFGIEGKDIGAIVSDNLSAMVKQLVGQITKGVRNVVSVFLNFVFMAFSTFFLLRDGPGFIKRLRDYLPFSEEQKDRLEFQVKGMVVSVIFGGVVVAVVQGLMGGTAFHFLGIKTPVIWGTAIAIMSFVPVLGTFSIWGPATVYLFLKGAIAKSFILLIVGTFGISMVDNILKPVIIGERTKMPTLVIFFSVLGGIKVFGPIGIIMGPLVVALFISVFEIFRNIEGGSHA
jgi:predicted PurR-regulated permease PerM